MRRLALSVITATIGFTMPSQLEAQLFIPPSCRVDDSHFLVKQAAAFVKSAAESRSDERRSENLADAYRVLNDAIDRGEEGNPNLWYYYGRAYLVEDDLFGADSAFTKVEVALPDCVDDIEFHRRDRWVPLFNQGIEALQPPDGSALAAREPFIKANAIYHGEPWVPFYLAESYVEEDVPAEAITHYKKMMSVLANITEGDNSPTALSQDTTYGSAYQSALRNTAILHSNLQQWDSTIVYYQRFREFAPDDADVTRGLTQALTLAGRVEEATELSGNLLSNPETASAVDLFNVGVGFFQADDLERAAQAFGLAKEKNPYFRDAHFNQVQAYFSIADSGDETEDLSEEEQARQSEAANNMLDAAQGLLQLDHQNEDAWRLVITAYNLAGNVDSAIAVAERFQLVEFWVTVNGFNPTDTGFALEGQLDATQDVPIVVPEITFEFVNEAGDIVDSKTVAQQNLQPETALAFALEAEGEGIAGWRYRIAGE